MPALTRRAKDSAQSISTSRRTHKGWRSGDLRSRRSRETLRMRALSRASRPTMGCANRSGRTRSVTTLSGAWTLGDRRRPFRDRTECMVARVILKQYLRRLAKAHRSTRNAHVHRNARLGSPRSAAMTLGLWPRGLSLRSLAWLALARRSRAPKRSRCNLDRRWR